MTRRISYGEAVRREPLWGSALLAVLASVALFVLANGWVGVAALWGLPIRWMYTAGHLLAGYGMSVLLWPLCMDDDDDGIRRPDRWKQAAIVTICFYHLVAAVAYFLLFAGLLSELTLASWVLKTLFCGFFIIPCLLSGDFFLGIVGVLLLVVCVAGCPFLLPDSWAIAQWVVAKVATVLLAVELYHFHISEKYLLY